MHSFKSCLLILAIYLSSSSILFGQNCGAAITTTVGPDPVCYGFALTASPAGSQFRYQWQKDGVDILGARAASFPVETTGNYSVIVSGPQCLPDTSSAVSVTVTEEEALFNANKKERINPQDSTLCGIPVKLTLENESKGENLTYAWEITRGDGEPAKFLYIEGTDSTSENPVLQFNEKGQYTVKLTIQGACFDANNPDGPEDPVDPNNPDAPRDGRYVHEEQVIIVYPQVNPQGFQDCEEPGEMVTLSGSQLATFDYNLGTLDPASITWTVPAGVTISDSTVENPTLTFERVGTYVFSVRFANECEFSDALPNSPVTEITVTFNPRPAAPNLAVGEVFICEGATYEIAPTQNNPNRVYNFYSSPTSNSPLNSTGPQPSYSAQPLNGRTVYYIAAVENGCESLERSMFTINLINQNVENVIGTEQSICADTTPDPLTGSDAKVGTATPIYLWESRAEGAATFTAASTSAGRNDQQNFSPPVLTETTTFRRTVTFEGCDTPNLSNEITIEVLPVIEPSENIIQVDKEIVCRGTTPVFTGNLINGDLEYVWQSSTTNATEGYIPAVAADGSDNTNGASFTPAFISQPTWYRRVARYNNSNCDFVESNEAILVNIDELPRAPIVQAADVTTCEGTSGELVVLPDNASTSALTYVWYTEPIGGAPIGSGSPFFTPPLLANTSFYVEAINANECVSARRTAVRVAVVPISANAGQDTILIQGQSLQLTATGGTKYQWTPSTGLSNDTIANPLATPDKTITYTVTVSNGNNCEAIDDITITVLPRIVIVNTFSPNRDGINEVWEIKNIENFPEATVEIFNRYGAPIFKSAGYNQPWDGTHNGNLLPLATYYYVIRLKASEKPFTGSVTIIR